MSNPLNFFSKMRNVLLRREAHRQKQYCYAALGRVSTDGQDPCEKCHDENCPVMRAQRLNAPREV